MRTESKFELVVCRMCEVRFYYTICNLKKMVFQIAFTNSCHLDNLSNYG
jgi:hypothetical protein